jgi:hypothetical protein
MLVDLRSQREKAELEFNKHISSGREERVRKQKAQALRPSQPGVL